MLNARRHINILGALTLSLILVGSALSQKKPADVPSAWKGLLGEYLRGRDTLIVFENDGTLLLQSSSGTPVGLKGDRGDAFRLEARGGEVRTCTFERAEAGTAGSLDLEGVEYKRINYGGPSGESFRIKALKPIAQLREEATKAVPPRENGNFSKSDLVELTKLDPSLRLDIRYATRNNFMGEQFYSQPRAFLQRPAAEALVRVQKSLKAAGYSLLVHDAYRPWYVTKMFWDATPLAQKEFVADPAKGSRHNRGCAVDLSLFDLTTGRPVEMVSGYDEFSRRAYPRYAGGTSLQRWHRALLRRAMEVEGFKVFESEWWHFDYRDWRKYPLGTATFEEIR